MVKTFIQRIKIGKKLALALGVPVAIAVITLVVHFIFSQQEYRRSEFLDAANRAFDSILLAAGEQAKERGFTAAVLSNPNDRATLQKIAALRHSGDEHLASALAIIEQSGQAHPSLSKAVTHTLELRRERDRIRDQIDRLLGKTAGDPAFIKTWIAAQTTLITQESNLAKALFASNNRIEQILEFNSLIKHNLFLASEFAGRERAAVAAAIGRGRPIEPATLSELMKIRGVVEESLRTVFEYKNTAAVNGQVRASIEEMERVFLQDFENTRRAVYQASAQGLPYPLDTATWIRSSTQAIDSILKVSKTVSAQAQLLAEQEKSAAFTAIVLAFVSLLLLAAITLLGIWIAQHIARPIIAYSRAAQHVAGGDLTRHVAVQSSDEIGQLGTAFNSMVESLRTTIALVTSSSSSVATSSGQISHNTELMAAGTRQQFSQTEQAASAVEEMTRTIVDNSKNASDTMDIARQAREAAEQGGVIVKSAIEGMRRIAVVVGEVSGTVQSLEKSSKQIGEITGVIDDIASQTNLLALNAAIEAARAGEQGKGFAVVAGEVRNLAERTSKATHQISTMIKQIQADTAGVIAAMSEETREVTAGIEQVDSAGDALNKIVRSAQAVEDRITQIASSNEEQSVVSGQIAKNVEEISSVTGETARGAQQIAHSAAELNRLTERLTQSVSQFKTAQAA